VVAYLLAALPLNGHAILKEATPAAHSVVSGPNISIRLKFNSRIDAARSRLYLNSGSHAEPVKISGQETQNTLLATITDVKPGEYRIHWQVLALDGHITDGEVPFTVR
jgi:hypothetical protein